MSAKTVFISYRRNPVGKAFAGRLFDSLKHHGYDAFLDSENIGSGNWKDQILNEVNKRGHFIIVLTPNALIDCSNPDDMVRSEFEAAIKSDRNIVPIKEETESFDDYKSNCPIEMLSLFDKQGMEIRHDNFQIGIDELIRKFIPPHKAKEVIISASAISSTEKVSHINTLLKYLRRTFVPFIDNLLTFFIIAMFSFILYNMVKNNSYDYVSMVPVSFSLKLFWNSLSLPKENRMIIQLVILGALALILIVFYQIGKMKSREDADQTNSITGILTMAFGAGLGYGISYGMLFRQKK